MDDGLLHYFERLQQMAFFSGYAFIYIIINVFDAAHNETNPLRKVVRLLPYAYALTGTLFLGLLLKDIAPDFSVHNIKAEFSFPNLNLLGLLSLLFWFPAISNRPVYSLFHSLIFFFFIAQDLFLFISSSDNKEVLKNDMKVFTDSLLVNLSTLTIVTIFYFLFHRRFAKKIGNQ